MTERGYRIEPYPAQRTVDAGEVIALWVDEAGLSLDEARRRIADALLVASDADGRLAGVSTAYLALNEQLGMTMWHVRVFVAQAHRRSGVALELATAARDRLREAFVSGRETRAAGMLFEVQHEGLKRSKDRAIWRRADFAFIGENARGDHVRVHYFPGAMAPEPRR